MMMRIFTPAVTATAGEQNTGNRQRENGFPPLHEEGSPGVNDK
jgi:hypothetical protein